MSIGSLCVEGMPDEQLCKLCAVKVDMDSFKGILEWARASNDTALASQASYVHHLCTLLQAVGRAEQLARARIMGAGAHLNG
eukprot:5393056-Amphidinium_carterae.3